MTDTFIVNHDLSFREYFNLTIYLGARMKIIKRLFVFILITDLVSTLFNWVSPHRNELKWYTVILPLLILPVIPFLFIFIFSFLSCLLFYKTKPRLFKNVTYRFTHWGMEKTGKGIEFTIPWRSFLKFRETRSFILLYVTLNDAHIIQKRMFKSHEELEDFKKFVNKHINNDSKITDN